jgi:hypothetical protein
MGEVIQLQGDQRKDVQEFLTGKDGLELDQKTIKVSNFGNTTSAFIANFIFKGPRFLDATYEFVPPAYEPKSIDRSTSANISFLPWFFTRWLGRNYLFRHGAFR